MFKHTHNSASYLPAKSLSLGLAVLLMVAIASACAAQDLPVTVAPRTAPPTAPAITVPPTANTASAAAPTAVIPVPPTGSALSITSVPGTLHAITRSASTDKPLHVVLGHSIFIDTRTRLRRIIIPDPTIVNSATLSPNQIIITAMNPGTTSLTLLDETGAAQSYVISSDVDVDNLRAAMADAMGSDGIKVESDGGRVTLSGIVPSQAAADAAVKLAQLYAKDVANAMVVSAAGHPKQVRLEVRILEVDRSKMLQLGVNLFNPGGNTNYLASSTSAQFPSTATLSGSGAGGQIGQLLTSNPLNFMLYSAKLNLGATIEDLQTKQVLQILADPTISTISGEAANFLSGGEFPFPVVQPGGNGGAPVVTIQFRPFGVKLEFTPVVNEDGTVRLKVAPEVSSLDYSNAVTVSGFTIPALSTRKAATEVELRNNQSFAITGLLDQRTTDIMSKNPGAANIPILGALFKSKSVNHATTELVIVVTPTVIDPLTDNSLPTQPDMPIPTLDPGAFDKSLGKNLNPKPTAPPFSGPGSSPYGSPAAAVAPGASPAAQAAAPAPAVAAPVPAIAAPAPEAQAPATPAAAPAPQAPAAPEPTPVPDPASGSARGVSPVTDPQEAHAAVPANPAPAPATMDPALLAFADSASQRQASNRSEATLSADVPRTKAAAAVPSKMVEVMALSHESDADAMVAALKRHGYDVAVSHNASDKLIHLDVGPFASNQDAESMRQRLVQDGYNATIK